jgi:Transglycosylase SLT domain
VLPLALLALAGVVAAAVKITGGANLRYVAAGLGLPFAYVQLADKWGKRRGLPLDWVLTTILVESGGKPNVTGDADGRSAGLMQVNTVAHAAEMAQAGVTRAQMFQPATNIEWGTKYLRQFRDEVLVALGGRTPPIPLDYVVRLAYKGPETVKGMLRRGENPATLSWAPEAMHRWHDKMALVRSAEARGRALLTRGRQTV